MNFSLFSEKLLFLTDLSCHNESLSLIKSRLQVGYVVSFKSRKKVAELKITMASFNNNTRNLHVTEIFFSDET